MSPRRAACGYEPKVALEEGLAALANGTGATVSLVAALVYLTARFHAESSESSSRMTVGRPPRSARCRTIHRGPTAPVARRPARRAGDERLAIIDLAGGAPMSNAGCPRTPGDVDVCNGEVYNHAELRKELEAAGHRFHTRCDTEAMHAYEEWGACVERLIAPLRLPCRTARRQLFAARDRLGVAAVLRLGAAVSSSRLRSRFSSSIRRSSAPSIDRRSTTTSATSSYRPAHDVRGV